MECVRSASPGWPRLRSGGRAPRIPGMEHAPLLLGSALLAGALNALAGGGSFLTFPALVAAGVPPLAANATSAVAVSPGYLGSAWGFRQELARIPARRRVHEALVCAAGGAVGAGLLLVTPEKVFSALVPWLLVVATLVFALGPAWLARRKAARAEGAEAAVSPALRLSGLALVAVYGGYFNGGLGILLMALYTLAGEPSVHVSNALKNLNSLVLSLFSVGMLAGAGIVWWPQALAMAVAATLGGWIGARVARRLPVSWVRAAVVVTGAVMSAVFFWRG